jgi:hypothetical protein
VPSYASTPNVSPVDDLAEQFKRLSQRIASLERASGFGTGGGGGGAGADEVWVGPNDPGSPPYELWYDTDAVAVAGPPMFATQAARDAAWPAATAGNGAQSFTTDKSRLWISNGTIWKLIGGSYPRVRAQKNTVQSVSATAVITWAEAELYDTDALHDTATNPGRITIPSGLGGIWLLDYMIYAGPTAAGSECYMLVNGAAGTRYAWAKQASGAGEDITLSGSAHIVLNAGDYVEVFGYSSAARNFCTPGLPGYFAAAYMGAS